MKEGGSDAAKGRGDKGLGWKFGTKGAKASFADTWEMLRCSLVYGNRENVHTVRIDIGTRARAGLV